MSNIKKYNLVSLILTLNIILFITILFIFPSNMPWVDDWEFMENLQIHDTNYFLWLIELENIHSFFIVKLLLTFSKFFLNFNFEFFNYLSILIIFISSLIISIKLINNNYSIYFVLLIILMLFTGKQFPNISQMCNIAWLITFLFIIIFWYHLNINRLSFFMIITITLAPLTLGFGILIPIYIFLTTLFVKYKIKYKFIYNFFSFLSIITAYVLPRLLTKDSNHFILNFSLNIYDYLNLLFILKFIYTYFGLLGSIFIPWIEQMSLVAFLLGLFQFIIILLIFLVGLKNSNNFQIYFSKFLINNSLLVMGLFFPILVCLARAEWNTSIQPRYVSGVLIFQIGFFVYCYDYFFNKYFFKQIMLLFSLFIVLIVFVGLFTPYLGIHWQIIRSMKSEHIITCYRNANSDNKIENCHQNSYDTLFYSGNWYDYKLFKKQMFILEKRKEIFF